MLCFHAASDVWKHELALPAPTIIEQVERFAAGSGDRTLHVTFDDAFRSVLDVLPALQRLGVSVTIFACTDYARDGRPLDVPELARYAAELTDELTTMDWDTLRAVAAGGVEIGSHTRTHPHLTRLSDRELELEVRESRACIEDELGRPCRLFAYPYGEEDGRVRRAARAAGYEGAYTVAIEERDDPFALPRLPLYRSAVLGDSRA